MKSVAMAIEEVIINILQIEYQLYIFSGKITLKDIICQVLVECCKYAYDNTSYKHSLNYYLKIDQQKCLDSDSERMIRKRTLDYIQERRYIQYKVLQSRGYAIEGLLPSDMSNIHEKLSGHQINEFQYWEINNVHNMRIIKAIVEKRIGKRNFTTDTFKDYAKEYDMYFKNLLDEWNNGNDNAVFDFLAMFTIEWKYSFNFFYELATEMVKCNVSTIPDMKRRIVAFCGTPSIDSRLLALNPNLLNGIIPMDSRMIIPRQKYVHDIVTLQKDQFEDEFNKFVESLVVIRLILTHMTYRKRFIREWFVENSTEKDWISVFRNYNVFKAFVIDKDWNNKKKIRHIKELYNQSSYDYKNPEYRS